MDSDSLSYVEGDEFLLDFKCDLTLDDMKPCVNDLKNEDTNDCSVKPVISNISCSTNYLRYFQTLQYFICPTSRKKSLKALEGAKPPKREYVRTKLIRGHKRAIRQSLTCQLPNKTIHKIDLTNSQQMDAWREFKAYNQQNIKFLDLISLTQEGPKTDGKNKRLEGVNAKENTFNNSFCKVYFSDPHVQQSFKLYANVIFENQTFDNYCQKFGFSCCERRQPHVERCKELWDKFENEVKFQFLEVLLSNQKSEEVE